MSLCLKGQQFVRTIGTTQYLILRLKHNILTDVSNPHLMNDIDASLQNNIEVCICSVQHIEVHVPENFHAHSAAST